MSTRRLFAVALPLLVAACLRGRLCAGDAAAAASPAQEAPLARPLVFFQLDDNAGGYYERIDNIDNVGVAVTDPNPLAAEYKAGFIQGKLQQPYLPATRDNQWDSTALVDARPCTPFRRATSNWQTPRRCCSRITPTPWTTLRRRPIPRCRSSCPAFCSGCLASITARRSDAPAALDFSGQWLPDLSTFTPEELTLNYGTPSVSFLDIYYLNTYADLADKMDNSPMDKCSAFVKRTDDDIYLTHNSWSSFLDQSMAVTYFINDTALTFNALYPGLIASATDFGYNNQGIMFNETTHHNTYTEAKTDALWMFWRAALAEQFAGSLDEFYDLVSLEPSGTYMNGYAIVDTKTREIGLVEMGYKSFVYFKSDGSGGYIVTTKPEGQSTAYDPELVQPDVILGVNYPASLLIQQELKALENRPARRAQFLSYVGTVDDIESAKDLVTYTDTGNPLSIFGRWDLGYGMTPTPKTVPDGSVDAKAIAASQIGYLSQLEGKIDQAGSHPAFWMRFGTPHIANQPFIWSKSQWKDQVLRLVPDVVDGDWQMLTMHIK